MTDTTPGAGPATGVALFDTAIGRCGVAWRGDRLRAVQLPEHNDQATIRRLTARLPGATSADPPARVIQAMAAMAALLQGRRDQLLDIELDLDGIGAFELRVYEATRAIPPGETLTYGEVARRIGDPGAARAVGRALGANPLPIVIPCHRVLGAGGHLVGFSANGGTETKRRMLLIEGATAVPPSLFD
jgi:methylated-DNA-[protein]-cysteine S-methyltransferase